ncbi:MAG: hypothetical protein AB7I41_06535 [Candidatus Sericytochromatia bacterium]
MGAYTQVMAFDLTGYRQVGIPALAAVLAGQGLDLQAVCDKLDRDWGVKHTELSELAAIQPTLKGGCDSLSCEARTRCPFHRGAQGQLSQGRSNAEAVMSACQAKLKAHCCKSPLPINLGKDFQFYTLGWWYGNELGLEYDAAERAFFAAKDRLPLLLARLCKRAGIWGWADGGFGEGCLGWLSAEEALQLAEDLAAYDLSANAPLPVDLQDDYVRQVTLPAMRACLAQLRDFAQLCGTQQWGLLLERH